MLLTPNLTKHLASEHSRTHGRRENKLYRGLQSRYLPCFLNLWELQWSWKRRRYCLSILRNVSPAYTSRRTQKKCWSLRHRNFIHFKNNHSNFTALKNPFSQKSLFLYFEKMLYIKYICLICLCYINTTFFFWIFSPAFFLKFAYFNTHKDNQLANNSVPLQENSVLSHVNDKWPT